MTAIVYGFIGAMFALALFLLGWYLGGTKFMARKPEWADRVSEADRPLTDAEQKERERLIAEQNAFRVLMSYNTDMAYNGPAADDVSAVSNDEVVS